jgi:type I restriction enzyme S subunit
LPAEISDLFPDSFEDSELGEIPSGWEIKKIGDIISRFPVGKRFDQKTVLPKGSIPVLDQSASGIVGYHDEEAGVLATKDFPLFTFANHTCAMRYMTRPFSVIQNVFPLRGNGVDTAWLYQASQGKQEITEYKGHYPDFIEKEVVVPSNGVDKIYGGDYKRILIKCDFSLINSVSLASIRDALLPKLISGEIRIPDAEKMLEEVGI